MIYDAFHLLFTMHLFLFTVLQSLAIGNGFANHTSLESFSLYYQDQWFPLFLIANHFLYHENVKFP